MDEKDELTARVVRTMNIHGNTVWGWYVVESQRADTPFRDLAVDDCVAWGHAWTKRRARRVAQRTLRELRPAGTVVCVDRSLRPSSGSWSVR